MWEHQAPKNLRFCLGTGAEAGNCVPQRPSHTPLADRVSDSGLRDVYIAQLVVIIDHDPQHQIKPGMAIDAYDSHAGRWRWEDQMFKITFSYIANRGPAWANETPYTEVEEGIKRSPLGKVLASGYEQNSMMVFTVL